MLATRLRELGAAGSLARLPLRHNTWAYALTGRGPALREAIVALARWGAEQAQVRRGTEMRADRLSRVPGAAVSLATTEPRP